MNEHILPTAIGAISYSLLRATLNQKLYVWHAIVGAFVGYLTPYYALVGSTGLISVSGMVSWFVCHLLELVVKGAYRD